MAGEEKMVKESDLIAAKKGAQARETKFKESIEGLTKRLADADAARRQAESQLVLAKSNLADDEEVKRIRDYLLSEDTRLKSERDKHEEAVVGHTKRERATRAKEIAFDMKEKGITIEMDVLNEVEDMDKYSHDLYVDFLAKENAALKAGILPAKPGENVFERGTGSVITKSIPDMSQEEFEKAWNQKKQEALSKV